MVAQGVGVGRGWLLVSCKKENHVDVLWVFVAQASLGGGGRSHHMLKKFACRSVFECGCRCREVSTKVAWGSRGGIFIFAFFKK